MGDDDDDGILLPCSIIRWKFLDALPKHACNLNLNFV